MARVVMTDSIAERQQAELVGRLESIRVNAGYLADLGANLYLERMHFSDDETFPLLNVQLVSEEVQSGGEYGSDRQTILRTFRVEIWRSESDDSATALLQDVKRAVMVKGSLGSRMAPLVEAIKMHFAGG
jgi:hypothetical protein